MNGPLTNTVFIQALLNRRDQYHAQARTLLPRVRSADEVWVTEAVLIEAANALSVFGRDAAVRFIEQCYHTANIRVVTVDTALLRRALHLYQARPDRTGSLTDCISLVVMQEQRRHMAVTAHLHFAQAGYRALMLKQE